MASGRCIFPGPSGFPHLPRLVETWDLFVLVPEAAGPEGGGHLSKLPLMFPKDSLNSIKAAEIRVTSFRGNTFDFPSTRWIKPKWNVTVQTSACLQTHLSWCRGSFPEQSVWNPHLGCFNQILFHSWWVCDHLESALRIDTKNHIHFTRAACAVMYLYLFASITMKKVPYINSSKQHIKKNFSCPLVRIKPTTLKSDRTWFIFIKWISWRGKLQCHV